MRPPLSYIPLLPITLSFIVGIIIADIEVHPIGLILVATIATFLFFKRKAIVSICLMALAIGWVNMLIQTPASLSQSLQETEYHYNGTIISTTESETSRHLIIKVNQIDSVFETNFHCKLTLPSMYPVINPGDDVSFLAKLQSPKNNHDLPDEWDMENFLYYQGITATAYIQPEQITIIGENNGLLWHIRRLQSYIVSLLGASPLSDETTEFLTATIVGDDSLLLAETRQEFSTSGLAHILALSGLHVGLIAIIIAIILLPLSIMGYNRTRLIITIILLWGYAVMTGLTPSVTRAAIMTTLYIIGIIIQRRHSSINALCFAALIILLFSPLQLYSAGFQLSFAAVLAILLFANRINPVNRKHHIGYYITSLACVSMSATLGTALISAYYFHSFPVYFLIANILVIFMLPVIIGGGVLLIIFEACGGSSIWICSALDFLYSIITWITEITSSLQFAKIDNIYFSGWLFIPYIITILVLFATLVYRKIAYGVMTIMLAIFTITAHYVSKPPYPQKEFFIPRDTYYTNIIARIDTTMYLYSTAHHSEYSDVVDRAKFRYKDYMGRRGVEEITLVTDSFYSPLFSCHGRNLIFNNTHFLIIDNADDIYPCNAKPDYVLMCRGFKGDIIDVAEIIRADSILLSYDLHPRRHNRYLDECEAKKIPCRSLRDR